MFEMRKMRQGLGLAGMSLLATLMMSGASLAQDAAAKTARPRRRSLFLSSIRFARIALSMTRAVTRLAKR